MSSLRNRNEPRMPARLVLRQQRRAGHHFVEHRALGVERVGAMLAEVTDLRVVPEVALAFLKRHHARQNFQQRGFARAVRPDQHRALAAFHREIEPAINLVRAVGHVDVHQRHGALPAARRLRNLKAERLARRQRLLDQLHPLDLLELAHRLRRLGRHGTEPRHELLERRDFLLLILVGGQLLLVTLLPLPEVSRCSCPCRRSASSPRFHAPGSPLRP